ncbi:2TM domain-containing protein [Microbacteriaceae bacterium VKM Ac-2855]|nr:2TM domain-containing protein [Microbacteriaceae bacterium VKM Ac-2855]
MTDWGTPDSRGDQAKQDAPNYPPPAVRPAAGAAAPLPSREEVVRAAAVKRLKRKQEFRGTLTGWIGISAVTTVIWAVTGADYYFWPIWPMIGVGIGVASQAAAIWGPGKRDISEEDVEAEIRRLQGPSR